MVPTAQDSLQAARGWAARVAALAPAPGVQRIEVAGRGYWVKRPEVRSLRWRLQKGDPRRSFARERDAWRLLAGRDLPLAPLVWLGPDAIVTAEAGQPLPQLLQRPDANPGRRALLLRAAAEALAALHAAGFAHGRPNLKDILWDGGRAVFVDLERFPAGMAPARARRRDLLLFAFSCHAVLGARDAGIDAALRAYGARDRHETLPALLARLSRLAPLARPAGWVGQRTGSREWRAVPLLFDWARMMRGEGAR